MGIIRKAVSVSTLGLVKFRSDGEAAAKAGKQTAKAAKANVVQNMALIDLQRQTLAQHQQGTALQATQVAATMNVEQAIAGQRVAPPSLPPGWYKDPTDSRALCWWDGISWNTETKHYPA
jgi:hypothetical protein